MADKKKIPAPATAASLVVDGYNLELKDG